MTLWAEPREQTWRNPMQHLEDAISRQDVVQGLVPLQGVTWLYGASMSFKTFAAMSLAAYAAAGASWLGKETMKSSIIYIGAEGGNALHYRRAAAELTLGQMGDFKLVQERPQIDQGVDDLKALIDALTGIWGLPSVSYHDKYMSDEEDRPDSVLCFIDTFAQTAASDDRTSVSGYIRSLRQIIAEAADNGVDMTFIVIDHATKAGGSYIGSVAKINDVDSQLEILRDGVTQEAVLHQRKCKDGAESAPIRFGVERYEFDGYEDPYGETLSTLVLVDTSGVRATKAVSGAKAGELLSLVEKAGGSLDERDARSQFGRLPGNSSNNVDTVSKAYRRAKTRLEELGLVIEARGVLMQL